MKAAIPWQHNHDFGYWAASAIGPLGAYAVRCPRHILTLLGFRSCSCDIATAEALVWEGYMAHQTPAYLFRNTFNVETCAPERQEQLSTGMYVLADVQCRGCSTALGWRYISASSEVCLHDVTSQQPACCCSSFNAALRLKLCMWPCMRGAHGIAAATACMQTCAFCNVSAVINEPKEVVPGQCFPALIRLHSYENRRRSTRSALL